MNPPTQTNGSYVFPVDILIHALTLAKDTEAAESYTRSLLSVTHVCREWRYTALSISNLWAKVYIPQLHPTPARRTRVTAFLRRSREAPLDIDCFLLDISQCAWVLRTLETCIARTRSLHFMLSNRFDCQHLLDFRDRTAGTDKEWKPLDAPMLGSLTVSRAVLPLSGGLSVPQALDALYGIFDPSTFLSASPSLRSVTFNHPDLLSHVFLPLNSLRHIDLTLMSIHGHTSLPELWSSLKHTVRLQTLRITWAGGEGQLYVRSRPLGGRIILPYLRHLSLIQPLARLSCDVFEAIEAGVAASVSVVSDQVALRALFPFEELLSEPSQKGLPFKTNFEHKMQVFNNLKTLFVSFDDHGGVKLEGYTAASLSDEFSNRAQRTTARKFLGSPNVDLQLKANAKILFDVLYLCDLAALEVFAFEQAARSTQVINLFWEVFLSTLISVKTLNYCGPHHNLTSILHALSEPDTSQLGPSLTTSGVAVQLRCPNLEHLALEISGGLLDGRSPTLHAVGGSLADCMELRDSLHTRVKELTCRFPKILPDRMISPWDRSRLEATVGVFNYVELEYSGGTKEANSMRGQLDDKLA